MIPNQWYIILESNELKPNRVMGLRRMGEQMVLWRDADGKVACLADTCPHRGAALSIGKVEDSQIQCPFHGFQFDASGRCQLVPANGKSAPVPKILHAKSYTTAEAHGYIWLWWGEPRAEFPPLPFFDDLDNSFTYCSDQAFWPVHYSRAIENQLDPHHLPFVHTTTIGRGKRTILDGPVTKVNEGGFDIWAITRVEDGIPARRPNEMQVPDRHPSLRFRFPNLWMNWISNDFRIFVSFTPIDDENMLFYLRYYQRFVRIPVLSKIAAWASAISSRVILNQDKRVVITQKPKKTELKMNEKLIPADQPIILYRSIRQKMIGG